MNLEELLAGMPALEAACTIRQSFDFDGWPVTVCTNSPDLAQTLGAYFGRFPGGAEGRTVVAWQGDLPALECGWTVNTPEPGKTRVKEEYVPLDGGKLVRKVQTGVHLFYAGDSRVCLGPLTDNPNQVINFINNIYLDDLLAAHGQLFHAAGVTRNGRGIGLAGQSGMGKSTLALRLIEKGQDLVSNDRLVVKTTSHGLTMGGVPKYPRINPGTILNQPALHGIASEADLKRFAAMPVDELWDLEEKYDAMIEACFPAATFQLNTAMSMFVLVDWDRHASLPCRLARVIPGDVEGLLPAVMKSPGILLPAASHRIGKADSHAYADLLAQTRLFRLSGGVDFDAAAELIIEQQENDDGQA